MATPRRVLIDAYEARMLDHQDHRLAAHVEPGGHGGRLVLGGAGHHADGLLLVERGEHRFLVRVGHAQDPAEVAVLRRLRDLLGVRGAGFAEEIPQGIDHERGGNGFGHRASWAGGNPPLYTTGSEALVRPFMRSGC
jgi:hypothetical protein